MRSALTAFADLYTEYVYSVRLVRVPPRRRFRRHRRCRAGHVRTRTAASRRLARARPVPSLVCSPSRATAPPTSCAAKAADRARRVPRRAARRDRSRSRIAGRNARAGRPGAGLRGGTVQRDAAAVTMVTQLGFTPAQVADALGVTQGAAKVIVHRARRRLRNALALQLMVKHPSLACDDFQKLIEDDPLGRPSTSSSARPAWTGPARRSCPSTLTAAQPEASAPRPA